ncbi:hypothetical protein LTR53_011462 [Teratosphaeriaceae sp. CCFEE 6253]|nr:hypothetical protein LTR53_011462 [Teratosphaeriaceae sp. CCFEE 6253]
MSSTQPTTMRTKSKPDRASTTAYAASQPLFDALNSASHKSKDQRIYLTKARDLVQNIHVKLVDVTNIDASKKHEQYVECMVKAWTSATEAYCSIFEELCKITGPDAAEGRQGSREHKQFKAMANLAAGAHRQASSYSTTKAEKPAAAKVTGKRARDSDQGQQEDVQSPDGHVPKKSARRRANQRARECARKYADADVTPPRAEQRAEPVTGDREDEAKVNAEPEPVSAGKENSVPGVVYEDVSAEVAARLQAKEDKKKAQREERKRKRESGDSAMVEAAIPERPSKKRPKTNVPDEAANGVVVDKPVKRKPDVREDHEGGGGPKKRVKSKA